MKLQKIELQNSLQEIYRYVGEKVAHSSTPTIIILESGHFNSNDGPGQLAINTLRGALVLANNLIIEHRRKVKIVLALLIDDLGVTGNIAGCSVGENSGKEAVSIPDELIAILENSPIYNARQLVVSRERAAKNRGIATLKNIVKSSDPATAAVFKLEEDGPRQKLSFISDDGQKIILADIQDWVWRSHCAMIMGQHYFDLHKGIGRRYRHGDWPQILIDFSSLYERGRVNSGAELAMQFLNLDEPRRLYEIVNICFADEKGEAYTIDRFTLS